MSPDNGAGGQFLLAPLTEENLGWIYSTPPLKLPTARQLQETRQSQWRLLDTTRIVTSNAG